MAVLLLVLFWICFVCSYGVIVQTQYGEVRGKTMAVNNTRKVTNVDVFRGIPFAKDTSGSRRFLSPEPVDPWDGIFEADTPGDACPQRKVGTLGATHPDWDRFSENCLHVDITSPNVLGGPYPVMFWIYGGGYNQGANFQYPGHFLAMHDVVVVSVNYRVNKFGFSYTGNAACPGNAGLFDQKMGLDFVIDNIANFGGDPTQITVFGESAGGTSTGLHVVSPQTKDLFQRAILESGSETNFWTINSPESHPENYIRQVAEDLDCNIPEDDQAMVDCLRQLSWESILENSTVTCTPGYFCLGMGPVVDGDGGFLPKTPRDLREDGDIMTGPIIAGITKDEGSLFVPGLIPEVIFGCCNRTYFLKALRERILGIWAPRFDNATQEDVFQAVSFNYSPWPHIYDNELNREAFVRMMTDAAFGYPWDTQLRDHQRVAPTYGLMFDYVSQNSSAPDWLGVTHGAEVAYVWGFPLLQYNEEVRNDSFMSGGRIFNDEDVQYSLFVQDMFTNFAKFGNPTPEPVDNPLGGSTVWEQFNTDTVATLHITRPSIDMVNDYEQKNYAFWREYLEYLVFGIVQEDSPHKDDTLGMLGETFSSMIYSMVPGHEEDFVDTYFNVLEELYEVFV